MMEAHTNIRLMCNYVEGCVYWLKYYYTSVTHFQFNVKHPLYAFDDGV
jgi:hypothetical protein